MPSAMALVLLSAGLAQAQPITATVPWVASQPQVPHDIISGQAMTLRGAEVPAQEGGARIATTYTWAFGDGTANAAGNVGNGRIINVSHTYNGAVGTPFTARLTLCDAQNRCSSADYPMVIRQNNLEARVNIAIEKGLAYLHASQSAAGLVSANGGAAYGSQQTAHASACNAFFAHGHTETIDRLTDPYVDTSRACLRVVFTHLSSVNIGQQTLGNPDTNGNGLGITNTGGQNIYQPGALMDAIVASGRPDADVTTGDFAAAQIDGGQYTYRDVVNDMLDAYAWGQMDPAVGDNRRGSWHYTLNANSHSDNSSSQWAAIGMIPAEREWGLTIPQFVKTENIFAQAQMKVGSAYGYSAENGCIWGCAATTPSGMVQLVMDGVNPGDARFDDAAVWVADNWGGNENPGSSLMLGYTYALFAGVKAFRLAVPPVDIVRRSNGTNLDWYNDPVVGVAQISVSRQNANGSFYSRNYSPNMDGLATQWHLLMLAPSLFAQAPKAVGVANPNQAAINQEVVFDHSGSFHLSADEEIVLYEWDFDDDGEFDFNTNDPNAQPTFRYNPAIDETPRTYTATLRVTDGQNPPLSNSANVQIVVDTGNVAPVARITPRPLAVGLNTDLAVSGATSTDPNAGAPLNDRIVLYEWDFDDSNGLVQFVAGGVDATARFGGECGIVRRIALRVTDTLGETHVAFADVDITCDEPPVARVDPQELRIDEGQTGVVDGSTSSDAEGPIAGYAWNCDAGIPVQALGDGSVLQVDARELDAPPDGLTFNCVLTVADTADQEGSTNFLIRVLNVDSDNDGVDDGSDNCPAIVNANQLDTDDDGLGDVCDDDDDNDGVTDGDDNCRLIVNANQADNDADDVGDVCDNDDDNDGVVDDADNCPLVGNANQADNDNDGQGDACDNDDDNDGVVDGNDNCQFVRNPDQRDTDGDGLGDACDPDDDNDGVNDGND
ncbi:MAG: hypothetical protein ACI9U2_002740, partial [Bradymonadia bacterium]